MADVHLNQDNPGPRKPSQRRAGNCYYIWDSRIIETVDDALFEPGAWARNNALAGEASGRGAAYFLQRDGDTQWVLRHSRRGGVIAHINDDCYVWLGVAHCRVFLEWQLLAELRARQLQVPKPVAARAVRKGPFYRCDLITERILAARPLSDWLSDQAVSKAGWQRLGATLARFHLAGAYHHDLNARNILINEDNLISLIDFDKSRIRSSGGWQRRNINRLRRSLDKIAGKQTQFHFSEDDWAALQKGYASVASV